MVDGLLKEVVGGEVFEVAHVLAEGFAVVDGDGFFAEVGAGDDEVGEAGVGEALVAIVDASVGEAVLATVREHEHGKNPAIGAVTGQHVDMLAAKTAAGVTRIIPMPIGEQIPRICSR